MKEFDELVLRYSKENAIRYSRYADDMTFSGAMDPLKIIQFVRDNLKNYSLSINEKKTNISRNGARKIVTGIVVNEKTNAPIEIRRNFWKGAYYIKRYGLDSHLIRNKISKPNYLDHLIGTGNFILFCNKNDKKTAEHMRFLKTLKLSYR